MTLTRHPLYFCLALSGSVHLGLILLLAWPASLAYQALQKIEVSYISAPTATKTARPALPKQSVPRVSEKLTTEPKPAAATTETPAAESAAISGQPSAVSAQEYEKYAQEVAATLDRHKVYPEVSRRLRQQGRVKVRFRVARDGHVSEAEVIEASTFAPLNSAARRLLDEIRFFRPFPAEVKETTWLFTVPIEYRM